MKYNYSYFDPNVEELGKWTEIKFFLKKKIKLILFIRKQKLKKFQRTQKYVENIYEIVSWKKINESKEWIKFNNIYDFINPIFKDKTDYKKTKFFALVNHKLCRISKYDYRKYRTQQIYNILKKFTTSDDPIVELGCGWGINLWSLKSEKFPNSLEGYEFTHNGRKACKSINEHFDCRIKIGEIDLTNFKTFPDLRNKTVFTYYVLEQLKYDTREVLLNIIKSKPKQVIHIEPIFELYNNNLKDNVKKLYIKAQDYQDNLLTTLQKLENENRVKILETKRLGFSSNPLHEAMLVRWTT